MTPDDAASIDQELLESLLAADALLADGRDPRVEQLTEKNAEPTDKDVAEYVDILRRLGHRTATAALQESHDTPPLRLGRFEIVDILGQGGFGIVYLARDPMLGREVALKVPRPEVLITPDVRRRFLREARAAAGLDHPHIVGVHEVGEAGTSVLHRLGVLRGADIVGLAQGADRAGSSSARGAARGLVERRCPACTRTRRPPPRHQAEQRDPLGASDFWFPKSGAGTTGLKPARRQWRSPPHPRTIGTDGPANGSSLA